MFVPESVVVDRREFPNWIVTGLVVLGASSATWAEDRPAGKTFEVQKVEHLAYYEGEEMHKVKHKLDLYLPRDHKDYPVLFFVHGGAWMHGDKNFFGVYSSLGTTFARQGVGVVVTNYRLSPSVKHPEHIKDVARAFAWTHRNIGKYGGRADRIFVCGHSAGGHLVALLATDPSYLKTEGLELRCIRGAIPMSGVYTIPENAFQSVFGKDAEVRKRAAPLTHAGEGKPPFLIIYADSDFPTCDRISEKFCKALQQKQCEAQTLEIKNRNHMSIITSASAADDPVPQAIRKFMAKHAAP